LNLSADEIAARIHASATAAAGAPVLVRVGDEVHGYRNIGVDLPRGRRSAVEGRRLLNRVRAALEARGVPLAETALAPKVGGDIRGSVQVRELALGGGDAAGLARG
jgi:hypothetical protein